MRVSAFSLPAFQTALSSIAGQALPVKTSFKIKKMFKVIEDEMKNLEEVKKSLVQRFGERLESGELKEDENGMIRLDLARKSEWESQVIEMETIQSEVLPLSIDELGEKVEISPSHLIFLVELGFLVETP